MQETRQQYSKVDIAIPGGIVSRTRLPQTVLSAKHFKLPFFIYAGFMIKKDKQRSKNLCNGLVIFDTFKKYSKYNNPVYINLLRSEHIPVNLFIPVDKGKNYCKIVTGDIVKSNLISFYKIEIQFELKPKEKYLNTGASYEDNIRYTKYDGLTGQFYRNII